jgi:hypothetical protein
MTRTTSLLILLVASLGLAACSTNAPPNGSIATAHSMDQPPQPRWTGNLRATIIDKLNESDTASSQRNYGSRGSVVWTYGSTAALSNATMDFTYSGSERALTWGIFFGPCGNASLPIVSLSTFPELEMSSGGHTRVIAALSYELPLTGAFHVEVFKDRTGDPETSVACGNLKFNRE